MTVLNSNLPQAWTPEDYGKLVDLTVEAKSVAFQAGTIVPTNMQTIRFPLLKADPTTGWVAENATIPLTDPNTDEIVVTPAKMAGRTQMSNESLSDSNPAVADQIGKGLARDIARKIDAAFFGNTVTNGASGLLSVAYSTVDTGATIANLDPFHMAKHTAQVAGAELSHFVLSPAVALALSLAKQGTGSNMGLLDSVGDGVTVAGVPVLVSNAVATGEAWGLDKEQIMTVRRTGTTVKRSGDVAFAEDATQIRATARVGFGFVNPSGLIRLYDAA
ncbi:phage major capsid protein [Nocardia caishijiensis]|uniref:HK97 family phage major capsid protein n=1 Tax=Nocardia caishijiensis TaxID=184756 RepID=A0ABQ6YE44_9NOCA|nr:phage major capsid protein [Nocardia caishijiensis]KAF0835679.1 HK97 family phage major capsid protein [Nocardia caishijiensis]